MALVRTALLALAIGWSSVVWAVPAAVVEGIGLPAWVVRDGRRLPMRIGETLTPGELVVTGQGSRALLRLADGSSVKLGENTRLVVASASTASAGDHLFRATLRVLAGAFRFTTSALSKARMKRDVTIQMATVTAGVRGTDLWGRSAEDREFVVLLEGKIAVRRAQEPEQTLDAPGSVFEAPRDAPTPPVNKVTQALLAQYAAETEIADGSGALRVGGKWKVTTIATRDPSAALSAFDRLREAGYPAVIEPVGRGDAALYRVRLVALPSSAEASVLAARLKSGFGFDEVKVSR